MQMAPMLLVQNTERMSTISAYARQTWRYKAHSYTPYWSCLATIVVVEEPFETDVHVEITYVVQSNGSVNCGILLSRRCPGRFVLDVASSVIEMRLLPPIPMRLKRSRE